LQEWQIVLRHFNPNTLAPDIFAGAQASLFSCVEASYIEILPINDPKKSKYRTSPVKPCAKSLCRLLGC
jgi:hypothetical protein